MRGADVLYEISFNLHIITLAQNKNTKATTLTNLKTKLMRLVPALAAMLACAQAF